MVTSNTGNGCARASRIFTAKTIALYLSLCDLLQNISLCFKNHRIIIYMS